MDAYVTCPHCGAKTPSTDMAKMMIMEERVC